nr:hypothetical protein [Sulfurivirga caldicuralii]
MRIIVRRVRRVIEEYFDKGALLQAHSQCHQLQGQLDAGMHLADMGLACFKGVLFIYCMRGQGFDDPLLLCLHETLLHNLFVEEGVRMVVVQQDFIKPLGHMVGSLRNQIAVSGQQRIGFIGENVLKIDYVRRPGEGCMVNDTKSWQRFQLNDS